MRGADSEGKSLSCSAADVFSCLAVDCRVEAQLLVVLRANQGILKDGSIEHGILEVGAGHLQHDWKDLASIERCRTPLGRQRQLTTAFTNLAPDRLALLKSTRSRTPFVMSAPAGPAVSVALHSFWGGSWTSSMAVTSIRL